MTAKNGSESSRGWLNDRAAALVLVLEYRVNLGAASNSEHKIGCSDTRTMPTPRTICGTKLRDRAPVEQQFIHLAHEHRTSVCPMFKAQGVGSGAGAKENPDVTSKFSIHILV